MGLLDFFRRSALEPGTTTRPARDEPGPLTACEAWQLVHPVVRELDRDACLTLLTSGLDISPTGRSFTWEFGFQLPRLKGNALLSIEPCAQAGEVDDAPLVLVQRLRAASGPDRPALPQIFRDSPEAVTELAAAGVDFLAGPTDMKLEARVLPSGESVWLTYYWDQERSVPFTPGA